MTQDIVQPGIRTLAERLNAAERSTRDISLFDAGEAPQRVRLFDQVDKTWTGGLDATRVYSYYLRLVVLACSACTYTSAFDGDVAKHVKQITAHWEANLEATPGQDGQQQFVCLGCDGSVPMRPQVAKRHLADMEQRLATHGTVEELTMHRFALGPSEPIILGRQLIVSAKAVPTNGVGSEASQVDGRRRKRSRNRSRRRGRSGNR